MNKKELSIFIIFRFLIYKIFIEQKLNYEFKDI